MECVGAVEALRGVGCSSQRKIAAQQRAIFGMGAPVDDQAGALVRGLATKVGHAVLGDDDLHAVLAVVEVRNHGNDRADFSALDR